jgi:imidazolonepropionase
MPVLVNIGQLACCRDEGSQRNIQRIDGAALVWEGEHIVWVGRERDLSPEHARLERWDAGGGLVVPGLVDCHTHLAFGGFRAEEFARRIAGESYLDIAKKGGGILSTVQATRQASKGELFDKALAVLREMATLGVTTIEAKSGYGLSLDDELKLLEVYDELNRAQPIEIVPTLLAAHVVPPEHRASRTAYVRLVVEEIIPEVARRSLAKFCDVFVEEGAFTLDEARTILEAAKRHGLGVKLHADQLSEGGGARLAAELSAASADHLEHASDDDLSALAEAGVVGVTLPLASLYTFGTPVDARRLLRQGVRVAVATDYNPGSAPSYQLPLAMLLACTLNRLTPAEALKGATLYAAQAIGKEGEIGSLEANKRADFAVLDAPNVEHLLYHFRVGPARLTVKSGHAIHRAGTA